MRRNGNRKQRSTESSLLPIILTLIMILVIALAVIAIMLWPLVILRLTPNLNSTSEVNQTQNITTLSPDSQLYFRLKNISCNTLTKDFLIVTDDNTTGTVQGLISNIPQEADVAQSFASSYDFNQTTKTYMKGNEMKKVIFTGGNNLTLIWKDGRFYQCSQNCTMKLLGDAGQQEYLDSLVKMRTNCAYFGRVQLPSSVNLTKLITIQHTGQINLSDSTCDNFLISGNKNYAMFLLGNTTLDNNQQAVIWGLAHQAGPIDECLDDGTGIVVYRNITLDLSGVYLFNYSPGGGMFVTQVTRLTYFSNNVPESFLGLPSAN